MDEDEYEELLDLEEERIESDRRFQEICDLEFNQPEEARNA